MNIRKDFDIGSEEDKLDTRISIINTLDDVKLSDKILKILNKRVAMKYIFLSVLVLFIACSKEEKEVLITKQGSDTEVKHASVEKVTSVKKPLIPETAHSEFTFSTFFNNAKGSTTAYGIDPKLDILKKYGKVNFTTIVTNYEQNLFCYSQKDKLILFRTAYKQMGEYNKFANYTMNCFSKFLNEDLPKKPFYSVEAEGHFKKEGDKITYSKGAYKFNIYKAKGLIVIDYILN